MVSVHVFCSGQVIELKCTSGEMETSNSSLGLEESIALWQEKASYSLESGTQRDTATHWATCDSESEFCLEPRFLALSFPVFIHCQQFLWKLNRQGYFHFKRVTCDSTVDQPTGGSLSRASRNQKETPCSPDRKVPVIDPLEIDGCEVRIKWLFFYM